MNALTQNRQVFLSLVLSLTALLMFGTIMVASAASALSGNYLNKHLVYLALAIGIGLIVALVPMRIWPKLYLLGWFGSLAIAVAVLIPGVGHEVNGATRWLRVGGLTLQASELAKFGLMLYLAGYLYRHEARLIEKPVSIFWPVLMVTVVAAVLVAAPDLGSSAVILCAAMALLFIAGAKLRYFLIMLLVMAAVIALLILFEPFRMQRLTAFINPWAVPFDGGYQLVQALIAFGRGGVFGLGLGESVQKLHYLPEAHNDFIFAVVAEELGGIGAICLLGLFMFFVLKIFSVAKTSLESGKIFAGYACYFVGLTFALQFLVNVGVNTGMLPTKGLTLPFISYGGNSLLISCAMVGLVLRAALVDEADHG